MKKFSTASIILGLSFLALSFGPLLKDEAWYYLMQLKNQKYLLGTQQEKESVFGKLLTSRPIMITPINRDFAIVIEKIGLNAPIVADVYTNNEAAYQEALKSGIAHAASSDYPSSEPGNVYLFAHASLNFWDLGKYATVFNLLKKMDYGDRIHIFFRGKTYVYTVSNKEIINGWNTNPITRKTIEPILTLQTCDPPGTTLNRLVVTANLKEIQD